MTLILTLFLVSLPIFSNGALLSQNKAPNVSQKPQSNVQFCGVRAIDNNLIGRVVGGRAAEPGEVPFYVSVEEYKVFQVFNYRKCGGVLISNRWVLTAAHCTFGWFGTLRVVLGEKLNKTVSIENYYRHPNFNLQTLANDIALLLLAEPVEYNEEIQPICLPEPGEDEFFYGLQGTVAGWGKLDPKSKKLPSKMQITTVPIIRFDECRKSYSKAGHKKTTIIESVVCAGYQEGGKDACFGDSGGPLMVNPQGHWVLAGIVSNGISCAKPDLPGIYTRVGYFLDWIKKTIYEEALKKDKLL